MNKTPKTIVQCDFDGTITQEDVSFLLLDAFARGDWRQALEEYHCGNISVGAFNAKAFAMIKADKRTLLDYVFKHDSFKVRPGFRELLDCCSRKGIEFVIISNGVDFYIEAILEYLGVKGVPVHAATSQFTPQGMEVQYIGPDGQPVEDGFKETYTQHFLGQGYRVVYVGNGASDVYPARKANYVFATSDLLDTCRREKLACIPFNDLNEVARGMAKLPL